MFGQMSLLLWKTYRVPASHTVATDNVQVFGLSEEVLFADMQNMKTPYGMVWVLWLYTYGALFCVLTILTAILLYNIYVIYNIYSYY